MGMGLGCFPQSTVPLVANNSALPADKEIVTDKDLPKRQPKASTCVALGNFQLQAAVDIERSPAQKTEMYEMGRKYFQQAIKSDAKCKEAYVGLAQAYQELGDHEREVATYQKAISIFSKDASFSYALGICHARHKEWDQAIDRLKAANHIDPENRQYANALAFGLARAGRYDESLACFTKLVGEAQAHYNVARMLCHVHDTARSKQHLQMALRIQPDFAEARQLLADLEKEPETTTQGLARVAYQSPYQSLDDPLEPASPTPAKPAASANHSANKNW
jgi:tetratricopeptide (TPR) repeat protein